MIVMKKKLKYHFKCQLIKLKKSKQDDSDEESNKKSNKKNNKQKSEDEDEDEEEEITPSKKK